MYVRLDASFIQMVALHKSYEFPPSKTYVSPQTFGPKNELEKEDTDLIMVPTTTMTLRLFPFSSMLRKGYAMVIPTVSMH